jgi:glycosyltransferase involved in cell wall biosynthesis
MIQNIQKNNGPLVSVLVPTFNRPVYLQQALTSILRQTYTNLQIIVVNDGGQDVSKLVKSLNDDRIEFIDRKENRGKAFSLNQALGLAEGKYIAYLDDDDKYYPDHIVTLVEALERQTDCQVAYSDFYKVSCRIAPDKSRRVLAKKVIVSRDFDRFFMLYFNHVLHVCLMHRRDLLEKTGLYNEKIKVLIDWDMTRRLAFFTDFHHVCKITGQYYEPVGESDRISVLQRKNKEEYIENFLTIRNTRPAKPWPKIDDLSIILVADRADKQIYATLNLIRQCNFYPYLIYLPAFESQTCTDSAGTVAVQTSSYTTQVDTALEKCQGRYVAIVPAGFPIKDFWLENPLFALIHSPPNSKVGYEPEEATNALWAVVVEKTDLMAARKNFPHLPVRESLEMYGVIFKKPKFEDAALRCDNFLTLASMAIKEGNWLQAAQTYNYISQNYGNELWMKRLAANAFFKAGKIDTAEQLCHQLNQHHPTVDTLMLEAKIKYAEKQFVCAIELLNQAKYILDEPCLPSERTIQFSEK